MMQIAVVCMSLWLMQVAVIDTGRCGARVMCDHCSAVARSFVVGEKADVANTADSSVSVGSRHDSVEFAAEAHNLNFFDRRSTQRMDVDGRSEKIG